MTEPTGGTSIRSFVTRALKKLCRTRILRRNQRTSLYLGGHPHAWRSGVHSSPQLKQHPNVDYSAKSAGRAFAPAHFPQCQRTDKRQLLLLPISLRACSPGHRRRHCQCLVVVQLPKGHSHGTLQWDPRLICPQPSLEPCAWANLWIQCQPQTASTPPLPSPSPSATDGQAHATSSWASPTESAGSIPGTSKLWTRTAKPRHGQQRDPA